MIIVLNCNLGWYILNKVILHRDYFTENEKILIESGEFTVSLFKFETGIEAVKIKNSRGFFTVLPYMGQQIWEAVFDGHQLGMESQIKVPKKKDFLLDTYGCLLVHCGFTAMGCPQSDDTHPLHGELTMAEYDSAFISCGEDECGKYVEISGIYNHASFFNVNYNFVPACRLYENDTVIKLNVKCTNMRSKPMEYMYLAHINFKPYVGAKMVASAKYEPGKVTVYRTFADSLTPEGKEKLSAFMDKAEAEPSIINDVFGEGQCYDPEIVFAIDYVGDKDGRAYTLQCIDDGYATYVSHPTDKLPVGLRWIADTGDEASMGILPATADHKGYNNAKRNGALKVLGAGETFEIDLELGLTAPNKTDEIKNLIEEILKNA